MNLPTFVVGTGRCGSTMLSSMLREHPKVLSLSEFFSSVSDGNMRRLDDMFSLDAVDGRRFWEMVAAISPLVSFQLRHHIEIPEFIYPCDAPDAQFSRKTGVPSILHMVLPFLTDNHDELYVTLREEVIRWPEATNGQHYRHLFYWLARHFGKQFWVERSGGFIFAVEQLLATFPDARFIHLVRDGRDTALSMQAHIGFRLVMVMGMIEQSLGVDPRLSADRTHIDRVPTELRMFLPENFDADALHAYDVSSPLCGGLWAEWMNMGMQCLASAPADRTLTLRYEDFFINPKRQLDSLAAFLGEEFIDEDWSANCAATLRPPRSTWRDLPEEEARMLTEACRPGFELLEAAGVHYEV